jgi:hypothetical protein
MNVATDRMCANEPVIVSKIMDGEAVPINLQTGVYYSLRDAGAVVWHALCGHRTRSEILQAIAAHFDEKPVDLESDLTELLVRFGEENLVRLSDRDHSADREDSVPPAPSAAYRKPNLEKFTDMEKLLALDPPTPGALDSLMRRPLGEA